MIVVDVGAMHQGPEESVHKLVARFDPDVLFAFDPHPEFVEGVEWIDRTLVVSKRAAAWTHDGTVSLAVDGICTGVADMEMTFANVEALVEVECFDLVAWLRTLPTSEEIVLKTDSEGSEYVLLSALALADLDELLSLAIVEWHPPETAHGWWRDERPALRCPVEDWE